MKIFYRRTIWWKFIHYNYFHKQLFKYYYVKTKKHNTKEIKKYKLYQQIDDIITLRKIDWLRILIFKYL